MEKEYFEFIKIWEYFSRRYSAAMGNANDSNFMPTFEATLKGYDPSKGKYGQFAFQKVRGCFNRNQRSKCRYEGQTDIDDVMKTKVGDSAYGIENTALANEILARASKVLSQRAFEIVCKRYMEEKTLQELGVEYKLSKQRVEQILTASIDLIRKEI